MDINIVGPTRMGKNQFLKILQDRNSPAYASGAAMYDCVVRYGIPAELFLAFFVHESGAGTAGICKEYDTKSPGNVRSPHNPKWLGQNIEDEVKGQYTKYPSWYNGTADWCERLLSEKYVKGGLTTIQKVIPKYAPSSDNNDPDRYVKVLIKLLTDWDVLPVEKETTMAPKIIDLRGKLPYNSAGGARQKNANKRGQVLHYSAVNYPKSRSMLDILTSEANFHVGPYLREATIAYHQAVDPYTGDIYLLRDEADVVWHCGYWGTPGNSDGLAVHVPGGDALVMTDVAVQSLLWLFGQNEKKYGFGRAALKGHNELSQTSCPGPLMNQVVKPYRAGTLNYKSGGINIGGGTVAKNPVVVKDEITGHTVHPDLADTYDFEKHGRPLKPACMYSDGVIRQLFERTILEVGPDGEGKDTVGSLGAALLFMLNDDRYPEWPTVKPLV